jgi:hypothetical protein
MPPDPRKFRLTMEQKIWRFSLEKWFWILFTPVAFATHLVDILAFTAFLSLYAIVLTLSGAQQGATAAFHAGPESGRRQ